MWLLRRRRWQRVGVGVDEEEGFFHYYTSGQCPIILYRGFEKVLYVYEVVEGVARGGQLMTLEVFPDLGFQVRHRFVAYLATEFGSIEGFLLFTLGKRLMVFVVPMHTDDVLLYVCVVVESGRAAPNGTAVGPLLKPRTVLSSWATKLSHNGVGFTMEIVQGDEKEEQALVSGVIQAWAVRSELVSPPFLGC